jgi:hypothetical protein
MRLLNMQRLMSAGEPAATAYVRAFASADKAKYSGLTLRASDRREAAAQIGAFVSNQQRSRAANLFGIGRRPMNESAIQVLTNVVEESVGLGQQNTDLPLADLVKQYGEAARSNNSFENYGAFAWRNKPGTKPLHEVLSVPAETLDDILDDEFDERLRAVGYDDGARGGGYEVHRSNVNGKVYINVFAPGGKMVSISEDQLRARKNRYAQEQRPKRRNWRDEPFFQRNMK